ncbi:MAG: hypothetical protein KC421_27480, partial [Anaerolineales bacterium]|nr:hypothetical protein [Anaerolineales bacterium]
SSCLTTTEEFIRKSQHLLENDKENFWKYYKFAVKTWTSAVKGRGGTEQEILQNMFNRSQSINFSQAFGDLAAEIDLQASL